MTSRQKRWEEFLANAETKDVVKFAFVGSDAEEEGTKDYLDTIPDGRYKLKNGGLLIVKNEGTSAILVSPNMVSENDNTDRR